MIRILFLRLGRSRLILEWNSPRHIEGLRKWLFCVFQFHNPVPIVGVACIITNIQILGLRLLIIDRGGSIFSEKQEHELTMDFCRSVLNRR